MSYYSYIISQYKATVQKKNPFKKQKPPFWQPALLGKSSLACHCSYLTNTLRSVILSLQSYFSRVVDRDIILPSFSPLFSFHSRAVMCDAFELSPLWFNQIPDLIKLEALGRVYIHRLGCKIIEFNFIALIQIIYPLKWRNSLGNQVLYGLQEMAHNSEADQQTAIRKNPALSDHKKTTWRLPEFTRKDLGISGPFPSKRM